MKTVEFEFNNQTYHLCMNGAALFDCFDKFGAENEIMDCIKEKTAKSFENVCWLLAKLSEQGELVRRYEGFDKSEMLSIGECFIFLDPLGVIEAKNVIRKVLVLGFSRTEEPEEKEVDIGLAELNQKKTGKSRARNGFIRLRRFFTYLFKRFFCYHQE